jgi:hypothetical protein
MSLSTSSTLDSPEDRFPWITSLQTLGVLAVVFGLYRLVRIPVEALTVADFKAGSFLLSALQRGAGRWPFWLGTVLAGVFAWQNRGLRSWRGFFPGGRIHFVVWTLVIILVWTTALYPYNYFYGRAHLADRLVILVLGVVTLLRPAAFPALLFASLHSYAQWRGTVLPDAEMTNRKMILDLAFMLGAAGLARPWVARWLPGALPALTVAFIGANLIHYWIPGLAKLSIGKHWLDWTLNDNLSHLTVSTYLYGWNLLWDQAGAIRLHEVMQPFAVPLKLYVVLVELTLLVAFWDRRLFVLLAAGRALLHAGIFVFSGDTFWNWILIQLAIVAAFWRAAPEDDPGPPARSAAGGRVFPALFSTPMMLCSMIYMLLAAHSHNASKLGWFDSQITERYALHAVMEDGRRLYITPTFFEPYDFAMIQAQFHFLHLDDGVVPGEKILTRTFGAIHQAEVDHQMRGVKTVEEARAKIRALGSAGMDPSKEVKLIPRFELFLRTWMRNYQARKGRLADTLHFLSPPLHAYVFSTRPEEKTYQGEPGVKKIEVEFERVLFDGKAFYDIDRRVVQEVMMEP